MHNFIIDTDSIPQEENIDINIDMEEYDSYLMVYTKNKKAAYKYGHKEGCEKQLSIILNHIRHSAMFRDLSNMIPEELENGGTIVSDADIIRETYNTDINTPLVQPLQFHALGAE
jgi:hypothetical protein